MEVSVIIPAYNVEEHISRAIASVRAQTHQDWEIIVVDDASADRTGEVVEDLGRQDARIRLLRHERNGGPGAARNTGLDGAEGEWIAVLDADDAWRPERLEKMLAAASATGSEFVADNHIFYDEALQREVGIAHDLPRDFTTMTAEKLFCTENTLRLGEMKPLIRHDFIVEHGIRYNPTLRFGEDFTFYAELLINGVRAILLAEPFYIYTTPLGFVSNQESEGSRTPSRDLDVLAYSADDLLEKYAGKLSPQLEETIKYYRKWVYKRWVWRELKHLRRDRKLFAFITFMIVHPVESKGWVENSRTYRSLTKVRAR